MTRTLRTEADDITKREAGTPRVHKLCISLPADVAVWIKRKARLTRVPVSAVILAHSMPHFNVRRRTESKKYPKTA
jgi:hypothetical protein